MKWITKGIETFKSPIGVMVMMPAPRDNELAEIDKDMEYSIEIKKRSKSRSLNANAFCWVLCEKIAKELSKNGYISKVDVYKRAIRECGVFERVLVLPNAKQKIMDRWSRNGLGWFAEDMGESTKIDGTTVLFLYMGSSSYDTKQMARLIDSLVTECNQLGIALEDSSYINSLLDRWEDEQPKEG